MAYAFELPDSRTWEMVSPLGKRDAGIAGVGGISLGGVEQASEDGASITYVAVGSFSGSKEETPQGAPVGSQYLARRDEREWATQNVTAPLSSAAYGNTGVGTPYRAFSSKLTSALLFTTPLVAPLSANAPEGFQNYYVRDLTAGANSLRPLLMNAPPEPGSQFFLKLEGVTPNLTHVVVSTNAALTEGSLDVGKANLYEWDGEALEAVNVLPDGSPGSGANLGSGGTGNEFQSDTISKDGLRVYWSAGIGLYLHERGSATVQVDVSHGSGESGLGAFRTASSDGSRIFFTDRNRLTVKSSSGGKSGSEDLYEYDVSSRELNDLTADQTASDPNGAAVQGVLGAGDDGTGLYFVARGVLAGANAEHKSPVAEGENLYVYAGGQMEFVGTLTEADEREGVGGAHDWSNELRERTTRVSPSGHQVVFMSDASLTGYDNRDASTGQPVEEVYEFNADTESLTCISCNPSGQRPIGPSGIPGGTPFGSEGALYQSRVLSADGKRVFFESTDALVPEDTNRQQDVYEYENGHVYLLSSGTSSESSQFVDADVAGDNAFFITSEKLVPEDSDELYDLYDARVNGGFPRAAESGPCSGEGCRPGSSPQLVFEAPGTTSFVGSGNLAPPAFKAAVKPIPKSKHKKKRRKTKRHKAQGKAKSRSTAKATRGRK